MQHSVQVGKAIDELVKLARGNIEAGRDSDLIATESVEISLELHDAMWRIWDRQYSVDAAIDAIAPLLGITPEEVYDRV